MVELDSSRKVRAIGPVRSGMIMPVILTLNSETPSAVEVGKAIAPNPSNIVRRMLLETLSSKASILETVFLLFLSQGVSYRRDGLAGYRVYPFGHESTFTSKTASLGASI